MTHQHKSDYEIFESSSAQNRRLLRQAELYVEVTELLSELLDKERVSKAELARKLGRTKGFVTQILSGGRNLTLKTIADVVDALGYSIHVDAWKRKTDWMDLRERFEGSLTDFGCRTLSWKDRPRFEITSPTIRSSSSFDSRVA